MTATATFCATLVDQWATMGLTDAFIAPGSRSTPLALALVADERVVTHLFHDERSASFACLGHGLATGRPAVLLCTSGTAATHFHGAVVEADASRVPMLVCTADRPPELWGIGAPQTIDQTDLYGAAVRGFAEPGPPDDPGVDPATWRPLAADTWHAALGGETLPGPVHLNLSFRDPLVGEPGLLPPSLPNVAVPASAPSAALAEPLASLVASGLPERGVIVVGRSTADPADVFALADATGWPVLADPRSGCRRPEQSVVTRFDSILRCPSAADHLRPDVIVRIGESPASKALSQWISASHRAGASVVAMTDGAQLIDPERVAQAVLPVESQLPSLVVAAIQNPSPPGPFTASWAEAESAAADAIDHLLRSVDHDTEPGVAREITATATGALVVSSSMPIRDVEWYGSSNADLDVFANRGANGIDGVISTAIGVALAGRPTTLLIGDVAFLHDTNALIALRDRPVDLTIVVLDNDGGGIFSFLPQHEVLPTEVYEELFGTPHGTDLAQLCQAHGVEVAPWNADRLGRSGLRVLIATTDRKTNLDLHGELVEAVRVKVLSQLGLD